MPVLLLSSKTRTAPLDTRTFQVAKCSVSFAVTPGVRICNVPGLYLLKINGSLVAGLATDNVHLFPRRSPSGTCAYPVFAVSRGWDMNHWGQSQFSPTNRIFMCRSSGQCAPQVVPVVTAHLTASTPVLPQPAPAISVLVPQRPVTAFTGLQRSAAASVAQQRRDSIQRNLHPNDSTNSGGGTGRKKKRMAGPPRDYSDPVPPLASSSLDDFAMSVAPSSATLTVGILPKVLESSDHNDTLDLSPRYHWKGGVELERVQTRLKRANLVFTVEVSTMGPIVDEIDTAFESHCRFNNIDFVSPAPSDDYEAPNTRAWVLTGAKGRSGSRVWIEDPKFLTRFTFTLQALRNVPFSYTPNHLGEGVFIFIGLLASTIQYSPSHYVTAPRLRNLFAPIDSLFNPASRLPDHVRPHKCFGRRVLHPTISSLANDPDPVCGPLYAPPAGVNPTTPRRNLRRPLGELLTDSEDEDVHLVRDGLPPLSVTISNRPQLPQTLVADSASSTIVTRSVRRQQWQEEAAATAISISSTAPFVTGPLLTGAMESAATSIKPRSFLGVGTPLDLTLQHIPGAGSYSFSAWQDHILLPHERGDQYIHLTARSVDEGARALITLCLWQYAGRPASLKLKELLQEQFPSARPTVEGATSHQQALFSLRVTIGAGIGMSPRNEVISEAVKIMLADGHYWAECGEYQTLRLHPSRNQIPIRSCVLKATGLLLLLHFLFIGAPFPVSPFLFSTLFDGRKTASKFDLDFLSRFISSGSLSIIKKIQSTPLDQPLYTSQSEECLVYQYLVNIPEFDPTLISPRRSEEEHDGICSAIISYATLGSVDIEHHPDFLNIGDGFNVVVEAVDAQDRTHHILKWFETPCRELLVLAYDRRIKAVADILSHLKFSQTNPENNVWNENDEIVDLITPFVTHYLTGHPTDPDQVISALADDINVEDPLLRASLFLSVLTGSSLLPLKPTWTLKCLITHDWSEDYPTTDAYGCDDYGPDVKVSFRSCFKTISITNNARLRQLLLSEKPVQGQDTMFGCWLHGELLASRGSYTSA
ncbi:hypothetical protein B0H17DRAFT_1128559 [Mycena rosella]|uniref:Uncharacterized protein n=1 Tax=Mycena rosella TaxID=1033263 RepID=A0AAD7DWK9_MYCRO|nr:hypothetical protein B0H17DRAFT_1128559 [Mycena rosella]